MTYWVDKKKTQKLYIKEILGDTVTQRRVPENLCASYLFEAKCQNPQLKVR